LATTTHYERTPRQMTGVRRTQRGGVSSAKVPLRRGADDWLSAMRDGSRVITLIDQFDKVLDLAGIICNSHGDKYTLYSLRHSTLCCHRVAALGVRRGQEYGHVGASNSELLWKARDTSKVGDAVGWVIALFQMEQIAAIIRCTTRYELFSNPWRRITSLPLNGVLNG